MLYIACIIVLVAALNAEQIQTVRMNIVVEDHFVSQDITTDPERNTVLSVAGEVKGWDDFKTSVNLHDFDTGYVALKNIADGVCLLKPISHNKNEHVPSSNELVLKNGQKFLPWHKTMFWDKDPEVMEFEEVNQLAGELLAEFCRDYKTYKLIPKTVSIMSRVSNDERYRQRSKRGWICIGCFNEIDGFEEDFVDTANKDF